MSHVIYNIETSKIYEVRKPGHYYGKTSYANERAAKAALTREVNKGKINRDEYAIAEAGYYAENIEKYETVINLMSGKEVRQSVNTPLCCDPSSETYWSM